MWHLVCILAASLVAARATPTHSNIVIKSESELRKVVFQDYDKLVRPVQDPATPVKLEVGLSPIAIKDVDEKNQILVLDSWILMKWRDDAFEWEPEQFGNISVMRLPSSEVWKPDLSVYTATPDTSLFPSSNAQVLIYNNKQVMWVPMFTISSHCPMPRKSDKSTFLCSIRMGSWTYSGPLLDLQLTSNQIDLSNFQDIHPEWKLQDVAANRESRYYPCCTEDYPLLYFNVTLKRRDSARNNSKNEVWPSLM